MSKDNASGTATGDDATFVAGPPPDAFTNPATSTSPRVATRGDARTT